MCILNLAVMEGLIEIMTFEQRLKEGVKGTAHLAVWGQTFQLGGTTSAKALRQEHVNCIQS